jgi:hypothetical protein
MDVQVPNPNFEEVVPMAEHAFQLEVLTSLTELRTDLRAVRDHLSRLNGSVARHEADIGQLKLDQARRQGEETTARRWWEHLKPAVWAIAGMITALVVSHAEKMIDFVK